MELETMVQDLEHLYERTRDREQTKQFFANVSHELRTPLALILGPVEGLLASASCPASSAATWRWSDAMRRPSSST